MCKYDTRVVAVWMGMFLLRYAQGGLHSKQKETRG